MKPNHLLLGFWPTIGDDGFNVGNTKVATIRDPRVKFTHRILVTTITGRKESTHRVIEIDLFYLYYIYSNEVVCSIPYWLAKYMVGMMEKSLICGGMFVTRITLSYGLLTNELIGALSVEPSSYVFKKKSLISMGVVIEIDNEGCFWPAAREVVEEDDEGDEVAGGDASHEGVRGSTDIYRNMSQGDWQVRQARWMDQYEADYPPVGYQGYMPPGYEYHPGPSQDES
nr:putative retrotransposon Orf1 [Tanacetum cinerariifolium]